MSASAANVFSGLIRAITPAIKEKRPEDAEQPLAALDEPGDRELLDARAMNIKPMMIPTVVIDASSN